MSSFPDRHSVALLVVDAQTQVIARAVDRGEVVGVIRTLVGRARSENVLVVWVQHSDEHLERGSDGWQLAEEFEVHSGEPILEKSFGDSFEGTELEAVLGEHGIAHLVVVGAQTDACVRSTIHGGFVRGYDVTLVSDGHTTEDLSSWGAPPPKQVIAHTNLYWNEQRAPGRIGAAVPASDIVFARM